MRRARPGRLPREVFYPTLPYRPPPPHRQLRSVPVGPVGSGGGVGVGACESRRGGRWVPSGRALNQQSACNTKVGRTKTRQCGVLPATPALQSPPLLPPLIPRQEDVGREEHGSTATATAATRCSRENPPCPPTTGLYISQNSWCEKRCKLLKRVSQNEIFPTPKT